MEWNITVKNTRKTIRDFLKEEQSFSRRILKSIVYDGGQIRLNGHHAKLSEKLSVGDQLSVVLPEEVRGPHMKPENIPIHILFEDDYILVLNKPAHLATIPSYHHSSGTLAHGILAHYDKQQLPYTVHIVTRLDRGTSGLVLVAKHRYSHSLLSMLQKKGEINRSYQAIVTGKLSKKQGKIDKNIGRKDGSIIERTVREDGKKAITSYEVMQKSTLHTLVDIQLETGRTHQIRVHFSSVGHPLLGDSLYGGSTELIDRQALHCSQLNFIHPFTKKEMSFTAPLPKDMKGILF